MVNSELNKSDWKHIMLILKENHIFDFLKTYVTLFQFFLFQIYMFSLAKYWLNHSDPVELWATTIEYIAFILVGIWIIRLIMWSLFINGNVDHLNKEKSNMFFTVNTSINALEDKNLYDDNDKDFFEERMLNCPLNSKFKYLIESEEYFILVRPINAKNSIKAQSFAIVPIEKNKHNLKELPSTESIEEILGYKVPNIINIIDSSPNK